MLQVITRPDISSSFRKQIGIRQRHGIVCAVDFHIDIHFNGQASRQAPDDAPDPSFLRQLLNLRTLIKQAFRIFQYPIHQANPPGLFGTTGLLGNKSPAAAAAGLAREPFAPTNSNPFSETTNSSGPTAFGSGYSPVQ